MIADLVKKCGEVCDVAAIDEFWRGYEMGKECDVEAKRFLKELEVRTDDRPLSDRDRSLVLACFEAGWVRAEERKQLDKTDNELPFKDFGDWIDEGGV